ncbi:hypothetical protein [Burkholderia sp. Ac-20365]|uniref:hypothetical protein n=1 Tax=Burkholderia sp. Ac-20365 TaxID=2703897 RepID=UPI00197B38F1|nr:hypothetical protein [Burkholderia sp. Ac-20365]
MFALLVRAISITVADWCLTGRWREISNRLVTRVCDAVLLGTCFQTAFLLLFPHLKIAESPGGDPLLVRLALSYDRLAVWVHDAIEPFVHMGLVVAVIVDIAVLGTSVFLETRMLVRAYGAATNTASRVFFATAVFMCFGLSMAVPSADWTPDIHARLKTQAHQRTVDNAKLVLAQQLTTTNTSATAETAAHEAKSHDASTKLDPEQAEILKNGMAGQARQEWLLLLATALLLAKQAGDMYLSTDERASLGTADMQGGDERMQRGDLEERWVAIRRDVIAKERQLDLAEPMVKARLADMLADATGFEATGPFAEVIDEVVKTGFDLVGEAAVDSLKDDTGSIPEAELMRRERPLAKYFTDALTKGAAEGARGAVVALNALPFQPLIVTERLTRVELYDFRWTQEYLGPPRDVGDYLGHIGGNYLVPVHEVRPRKSGVSDVKEKASLPSPPDVGLAESQTDQRDGSNADVAAQANELHADAALTKLARQASPAALRAIEAAKEFPVDANGKVNDRYINKSVRETIKRAE